MTGPTVSALIRGVRSSLTPSEMRVIEALLDDYPVAGLGSVADLAHRAHVSAPTVVRLVNKIGFSTYADFRDQLKTELSQRLFNPSENFPDVTPGSSQTLPDIERTYAESIRRTFAGIDDDLDRLVPLLTDTQRSVFITGGWSSSVVAQHLANYLNLMRPGVEFVAPERGHRSRALLSIDDEATVILLDYRRYQPDTVEFGQRARRRGARIALLTDPALSPLASDADIVLATSVTGPAPFDSLSCAFMVAETIISLVAGRLGTSGHDRLADFERWLADEV